jgi:hypothetical protein
MKDFLASNLLLNSAELARVVGVELESINNWIRRGIISRSPIGGRQLRNRLFSIEAVYKTALKSELVKLGIQPSSASEAVDQLWKIEKITELLSGKDTCAAFSKTDERWSYFLFRAKSGAELKLHPQFSQAGNYKLLDQSCVLIPLSNVFSRIGESLSNLLGDKTK